MRIVCGLGNPGPEYEGTRHNVGFATLDEIASRCRASFKKRGTTGAEIVDLRTDPRQPGLLVKPMTFMNRSGEPLAKLMSEFEVAPSDVLVVVDDFAIDLGRLRLRGSGSDGGHNGLRSIAACLKSQDYARLRVGIGPCTPRMPSEVFVLQRFRPGERDAVTDAVVRAADAAEDWLRGEPVDALMNRYNTKSND